MTMTTARKNDRRRGRKAPLSVSRNSTRSKKGFVAVWLRHAPALAGCGARIVPRSACTLRPLPLFRFAASAAGGAHLRSTKYSLRFLATHLAHLARRIGT